MGIPALSIHFQTQLAEVVLLKCSVKLILIFTFGEALTLKDAVRSSWMDDATFLGWGVG